MMHIGIYKHYKGNFYKVIGVAYHTETKEEMVVYQALYDENKLWVRPKIMFEEEIIVAGIPVKRFMFISEDR